jgi:hypothetical protein
MKWQTNPPKENGSYWVRRKIGNKWYYSITSVYWHSLISPKNTKYTYIDCYRFSGTYNYRYNLYKSNEYSEPNKYHKNDDGIFYPTKYKNLVVEYYPVKVNYIPDLPKSKLPK